MSRKHFITYKKYIDTYCNHYLSSVTCHPYRLLCCDTTGCMVARG